MSEAVWIFPRKDFQFRFNNVPYPPPVELRGGHTKKDVRQSFIDDGIDEARFVMGGSVFPGIGFYCLALRGFTIYSEPQESRSDDSDAIYIAEFDKPGVQFLLQCLPPHSKTSRHSHDIPITEIYHMIEGNATLIIDGIEHVLSFGDIHIVGPERIHQVRTDDLPSLILLEIIGNTKPLAELNHNYV